MLPQSSPSFFSDRGIPPEIWQTRPYVWWTPDNIEPAKELFVGLESAQRASVTKVLNQSAGWVISRSAPPMPVSLPHIYPELRPLNAVKTQGPRTHWHGDGEPPEGLPEFQMFQGNSAAHIARGKAADDHHSVNTEEVHSHQRLAKYVFPSSPMKDEWYEHDHASASRATEAAKLGHLAKAHDGTDVSGPHHHKKRVKDESTNLARRIDVHPLAVQKLIDDEVVFFVIEGCLKADSVLAAGGAVFSVPSVSLWDCDELTEFSWQYLRDKTVVIVPDADWADNAAVINQARLCQTALYRTGVSQVHVAAPPSHYNGHNTKGVDDFIGVGGHLDDLLVINSTPPGDVLTEFLDRHVRRRDQSLRDGWVLYSLSAFCGTNGILCARLKTVARVIGITPMAVTRAVRSLEGMGAVRIEGNLSEKRDWFSRQWDWTERPTITLIPELRAMENTPERLGDKVLLRRAALAA